MPFVRRKLEDCTFGIPAVSHADPAIGQARYFNAIAV